MIASKVSGKLNSRVRIGFDFGVGYSYCNTAGHASSQRDTKLHADAGLSPVILQFDSVGFVSMKSGDSDIVVIFIIDVILVHAVL